MAYYNPINEQNNAVFTIDGRLRHLPILRAWKNSSSVYWINPSFPVEAMQFKVGNADMTAWAATLPMCFHPKRGLWRVYIPGKYFTGRYETRYEVSVTDEYGNRHVAGDGLLRVYASAIPDGTPSSPESQCYAMFPDGKCRAITITEDDTGAPIFSVGEEMSIEDGFDESLAKPIYAYNNATGFYHVVNCLIDEADEPALSLDEKPSDGGEDTFVLDGKTGFFHRIEAGEDESGYLVLKTGEGISA